MKFITLLVCEFSENSIKTYYIIKETSFSYFIMNSYTMCLAICILLSSVGTKSCVIPNRPLSKKVTLTQNSPEVL